MLRRRIVPCLDVRGGRLVKGVNFEALRDCGDPVDAAERYAGQGADEIVWLNISAGEEDWRGLLDAVEQAAERVDVPLCCCCSPPLLVSALNTNCEDMGCSVTYVLLSGLVGFDRRT